MASQIRIGLPMQCRLLRESREWTQPQLAEAASMSQPRISEIERPGERRLNLETLLRLASAFDVALQVRFVAFSQLVDDDEEFDVNNHYIRPFSEDIKHLEKIEADSESVIVMRPAGAFTAAQPGNLRQQSADTLYQSTQSVRQTPFQKGADEKNGNSIDSVSSFNRAS